MEITVRCSGILKDLAKFPAYGQKSLKLDRLCSLEEILSRLGIPKEAVMLATVNGEIKDLSYLSEEGDQIKFFPLLGGG